MEILVSVAESIMGEYVIKPIGRQLSYLLCYNRNKNKLKEQLEALKTARRDVQGRVQEARSNAYAIREEVSKWLTDADNAIHDELSSNSSNPSAFNLVDRYQLGRKTKKKIEALHELIAKRINFVEVGYPAPLLETKNIIVPGGYQVLESKISMAKQIKKALQKAEVSRVGVYGMGGVGKTYLLNEVKKMVLEEKVFDRVIEVCVGQSNGVIQIQEQIGDVLNVRLPKSKEGRASFIRNNLVKMEGSVLIILDDLWKEYDLVKEIGIPCSSCKVLMTSRSQDILMNNMNTTMCFQVNSLSEEESWKFFTEIIGDEFDTPDMENLAKMVVRECGGLPLALDTVAKALKGKHMNHWKDALSKLRNSIGMDIKGVSDKVYASLRLSYDHLVGEEPKLMFLLCSVFPDDYKISLNDLQMYAMGMRILRKVNTWEDMKNRVMKLVHDLKSCSLLLDADEHSRDTYVKMHDVVRDVAIHIASMEGIMTTMSFGSKLSDWEDEYRSGAYRAIFVNCDNFQKLPQNLNFPDLELLILRSSNGFVGNLEIPDGFFAGMEKIKALDITGMSFLQTSWRSLKNIRTLCLLRCEFNHIDTIGELKNLEILRICSCNKLDHLPVAMNQLTELKVLEVLNCSNLEVFPANVISSMNKLEVLKLRDSFDRWGEEVGYKDELIMNIKLSELNCLERLSSLRLESSSVKILSEITSETSNKLKEFWVCVNESDDFILPFVSYEYATTMILIIESQTAIDGGLETLLKRSERLVLSDSVGRFINEMFNPIRNGYPFLKYLWIIDEHGYSNLPYLFRSDFNSLEFLTVYGMKRLMNLSPRNSPILPFKKLKSISIQSCGEIRNLFSISVLKVVSNLQEISVTDCGMMDEIISIETEEQSSICSITSLTLEKVDKLTSFCTKLFIQEDPQNTIPCFDQRVSFPELKHLSITKGNNLETLWHSDGLASNSFSKLQTVRIEGCKRLRCMFPSNTSARFNSLERIEVRKCGNLKQLLPSSMLFLSLNELSVEKCNGMMSLFSATVAKGLVNLRSIKVRCCREMRCVVAAGEEQGGVVFGKLKSVELDLLPELGSFYCGKCRIEFPRLECLIIGRCPLMKAFSYGVVVTPRLDSILMDGAEFGVAAAGGVNETIQNFGRQMA
ncbi:probable disease resistance protein At4g27220 isoform X3 [Cucurbita moschata]|uniref:Probable disease resistance protein At4g27220 isoform X3 n=1 Tax=Cucurbita moschata TaxID=3662 RepID=A0A6J1FYN5_CUCMO|nr:probable disease resistance protein At4g27220 isoform X3 [Cucurbita moschata]